MIDADENKKLNLGCGQFAKPGYINVDIDKNSLVDLICDLNKFPYPFKDSPFELIIAEHVLEHLDNPFEVMRELHRLLPPEGKLIIKLPHFSRGFTHPQHKAGFDVSFPYYFCPGFKEGYTGVEFVLERVRLRWFSQLYLKRKVLSRPAYIIMNFAGEIIDFLANISPFFCSRCWVYWVGGLEEIEFHFIKPTLKSGIKV